MQCRLIGSHEDLIAQAAKYRGLRLVVVVFCMAVIVIIGVLISAPAQANSSIHWQDRFTASEQEKLRIWVTEVTEHIEMLVGPLPFEIDIRFFRHDRAGEPVPWANTRRGDKTGLDFHVDPSYSLEAFRQDWTAAHEVSHLILPYLGSHNAWFAEGFASFMQYQVMQSIGVLSKEEKVQRYRRHLSKADRQYAYPAEPFVEIHARLRREGKFSLIYWGGAVYFLQINDYLGRTRGLTLIEVLRSYVACCRVKYDDLESFITELDQLTGSKIFTNHLVRFRGTVGFPKYKGIDLGA